MTRPATLLATGAATHSLSPEDYPTTWDAEGRQWTIQFDQGRMVASTGEVVELTDDLLAEFMNTFGAVEQDAPDYIEQLLGSPDQCTGMPDNPCDAFKDNVNRPALSLSPAAHGSTTRKTRPRNARHAGVDPSSLSFADLSRAGRARANGQIRVRHASDKASAMTTGSNGRRRGFASRGTLFPSPKPAVHDVAGMSGGGGDCLGIARSINDAMPAWRSARDRWKRALADLVDVVTWDPVSGTWGIKRPEVEKLISLDQAAYDLLVQQTTLNILAIGYTQAGCRDNLWPDATVASWSSPGVTFQCHQESDWEISFDGGETWEPITVTVCEFVNMA